MASGRGAKRRRLKHLFKVGDLVKYTFRTWDGNSLRPGLIIGLAPFRGDRRALVWRVQGFDGLRYKIHNDYLLLINDEENT